MYKKNTAGQFVHFQGVDATTGGIKSGVSWTIRRCIDGTFAAGGGSVGEDGSTGWYKYAMSQADTNGNDIGYNFTGTGAVPQTVNITTDGSPIDVNVTQNAGSAITAASGIQEVKVASIAANAVTATAIADGAIDAATFASGAVNAAALATDAANEIADALLARNIAGGSSTGRTVSQALYFLRNKWTIVLGLLTVFGTDDTTESWTATVGTDAAAVPIVSNDPA